MIYYVLNLKRGTPVRFKTVQLKEKFIYLFINTEYNMCWTIKGQDKAIISSVVIEAVL